MSSKKSEFALFKLKEHKMHLERLVTTKPGIDTAQPKKPSFLVTKAKKKRMEQEWNEKILYENTILLKKIVKISNNYSTYHPQSIKIPNCPAFQKTEYKQARKSFNIMAENQVYRHRVGSAKPHYPRSRAEQEYKQNVYFNNMISKTKSNINPNLNFETPGDFIKKVEKMYLTQLMNEGVASSTLKDRPSTATSSSKQRSLSATSKPVRNISSSKPPKSNMNLEYVDSANNTNSNQNNDLFDEANFEEN